MNLKKIQNNQINSNNEENSSTENFDALINTLIGKRRGPSPIGRISARPSRSLVKMKSLKKRAINSKIDIAKK